MLKYTGELSPLRTDLSILKDLKLKTQPVGVKFLYDKPEGIKKLDKNQAICLMPEEAQKGAFYVDAANYVCAEPLFLGIANDDPFSNAGMIGTKEGLDIFQEARANRRIYYDLPALKKGTCNYMIFAPLSELNFDPDVLIITGTVEQAEIIMRAYTYSTGFLYESKTTPVIGCAWTFAYPYITGKLNYLVGGLCFGHRARKVSTPGLVTVSIPYNLIKLIIDNLQEMTWNLPSYSDTREEYTERFKRVTSSRLIVEEE
ncbi:MAG: DUF169 domain-containing protein [Desulfitobacteriia bacterium]|jgi:uncharacterized protein (DUF169 family)